MRQVMKEEIEQEELYEHFRYVAHDGQEPLRVDKFLMNFTCKKSSES